MNRPAYFACFPLLILFSSCSSYLAEPAPASAGYLAASQQASKTRSSQSNRILIKTGNMSLETSDVETTSSQAQAIVKKHKGYVGNTSRNAKHDGDAASASLELRVPAASLDICMQDLGKLAKVTSRTVQVSDVTDQWIDLQAKLNNTRALRDRLRKLLQQADSVEDTLKVEKELTRVQSELDALEGKIKTLSKHRAYSKLSLTISQKTIPGPLGVVTKGTWWGVKNSL